MLHPVFLKLILDKQNCFEEEQGWRTLLQLLPKDAQEDLEEKWVEEKSSTSSSKWQDVEDMAEKRIKNKPQFQVCSLPLAILLT